MSTTIAAAITLGALTYLLTPHLLTALPAPRGEDSSPYTVLATRRASAWMGTVCAAMTWAVLLGLPQWCWPVWLVLTTVAAIAVCIDMLSCWIPRALTDTATALILGIVTLAWAAEALPPAVILRCLAAGFLVRSFFWLMWRLLGSMGFGDVRLALLCGLGTGLISWQAVALGTLLGTLLALVPALTSHRGSKHFPYGPGLLLGALLGALFST